MQTIFSRTKLYLPAFLLLAVLACVSTVRADTLSVNIINPNQTVAPTSTITYQGTITNNTGFTLDAAADLFFNFNAYDPTLVNPTQLLGVPPELDFTIPDGTTSATVDLFTFALGPNAPPGMYSMDVSLEDSFGDLSATTTVTETVATPEPRTWALLGTGLLILLVVRRRSARRLLRRGSTALALFAAVLMVSLPSPAAAQVNAVQLVSGTPGTAVVTPTLMVGLPITNNGTVAATNVEVTSAALRTATLVSPTVFPVALGNIAPGQDAIFQADFSTTGLAQNTPYLLTIRGTYQVGGATAGFTVNHSILLPPASPGSGTANTTTVPANTVTGAPYPHQPPNMTDEVNEPGPPVPTGPFVPGTPTPIGSSAFPAPPISSGSAGADQVTLKPQLRGGAVGIGVTFDANQGLGFTSAGIGCIPGPGATKSNPNGNQPSSCAEPSGAESPAVFLQRGLQPGVIFVTSNWLAAYSSGGGVFNTLDPTKVFPKDAVGFCCDQIVQYVPSIDRFIWLLQGTGYRLASASPSQITSSGGMSWTYWNLTPGVFGTSGSGFDYPDLSVGNNYLYISWDAKCAPNCNGGRQVARVKLSDIQAGGTIGIDYTNQSDSNLAWGSHVTQNTKDEIFWAGHNGNSTLRVFSWAEGSGTYFWRDIGISTWANNTLSSTTPDGQNWFAFGFPGNSPIGATRSGNQLWFAWTAGTDNNFSQDHIEMVTLDRNNNFNPTQQVQIWNNSYAFGYPALATNACTGEIGLSLEYGGNGNYENHAVGFWGDFVVYVTSNSSFGEGRYGDYVTIRQAPGHFGAFFDALGYGVDSSNGSPQADVRYVEFGRGGACQIN
ncbi:MAG TPA: PEP-CTERM sorting domain-containing protein [Terriglobia bacterium]|nr:PEP-CTERM sorting domain-containing protein [Terriglobia bacterium]